MTATIRRPGGLMPTPRAEPAATDATSALRYDGSSAESYAADRRARLHRGRLVGFAVVVPLWALSVVPMARESLAGREGAGLVLVYLAVGALSLGVAAALRGAYVLVTKRRFSSPWVFPLAAFVAIAVYTVQTAGEAEVPPASARAVGSAETAPLPAASQAEPAPSRPAA